jgi:hypothetical protein
MLDATSARYFHRPSGLQPTGTQGEVQKEETSESPVSEGDVKKEDDMG